MKKSLLIFFATLKINFLFSQTLSVDFSSTDTVANMSGSSFGGMNATDPPDSLIVPLNLAYWRGWPDWTLYNRATSSTIGAKYIILVSDFYGYPRDFYGSQQTWTPPYNDTTAYKANIDSLCTLSMGSPMIYDIWNEPDLADYWAGTQAQFFSVFKLAHDRIRQKLGYNVKISGPSLSNYDTTYVRAFCNYCLGNNIQLDVLSFHWDWNYKPDTLSQFLIWCRTNFINNPTYTSLQIKKIIVNEVTGDWTQYRPGLNLANYYNLEKGKADGACRSCWLAQDGSGTDNCVNNTLLGLLTPGSFEKRANWWAMKSYAELDSIRYTVNSSNPYVYSMTGKLRSSPNTIRAVIGYYQGVINLQPVTPFLPVNLTITLNNLNLLANFSSTDSILVTLYEIPNTEFSPLSQPNYLGQYTLANNTSSITLPLVPLDTNAVIYADIVSTGNITTALNKPTLKNNITFYPNPANTTLFISGIDNSKEFKIEIYNPTGQILCNSNNKTSVDISLLKTGTYFLKIRQGNETHLQKFIKE